MNYLLLGGAGFIGTHLAKNLMEEGHDVTIIDSLKTSTFPDYGVNFIKSDITELELDTLVRDSDIVYFLAGSVGVSHIDKDPRGTLFNNINLVNKIIPVLERRGKKVIFSSTSEVYGEGPFKETDSLTIGSPDKLRWGYACAKLVTEFMIRASKFPSVIVRFFNVVGPGQSGEYGMVMPRFVTAAKEGGNLIVYGDGQQTRSFCHVKDAIQGLRLVESEEGIFNIGNDTETRIEDLAKEVISSISSTSNIEFRPYKVDFSKEHADIRRRVPNLDKIRGLGYEPKYILNDIIKDML